MTAPSLRLLCRMAFMAAVMTAGSGCACLHRQNHCRFDDCDYEKATVVYELSGTCGALASTAIRRAYMLSTEPAELSELAEPKRLTWQSALVTIQYPHPTEGECAARATVRLSHRVVRRLPAKPKVRTGRKLLQAVHLVNPKSHVPPEIVEKAPQTGASCGEPDEIWTMELSKQELNLLLCDLSTSGFFGQQWRPQGGGKLYVDVNGCVTRKAWTPEPRLDDLIARVFGEGSLELEVPDGSPAPTEAAPVTPGRVRVIGPPGVLPDPPPPGVLPDPPPPLPEPVRPTSSHIERRRAVPVARISEDAETDPAWHGVTDEEAEAAAASPSGLVPAVDEWYGPEHEPAEEESVDPASWDTQPEPGELPSDIEPETEPR